MLSHFDYFLPLSFAVPKESGKEKALLPPCFGAKFSIICQSRFLESANVYRTIIDFTGRRDKLIRFANIIIEVVTISRVCVFK